MSEEQRIESAILHLICFLCPYATRWVSVPLKKETATKMLDMLLAQHELDKKQLYPALRKALFGDVKSSPPIEDSLYVFGAPESLRRLLAYWDNKLQSRWDPRLHWEDWEVQ